MKRKRKPWWVIVGIFLGLFMAVLMAVNVIATLVVEELPDGTYHRMLQAPNSNRAIIDTSYKIIVDGNQLTTYYEGETKQYTINKEDDLLESPEEQVDYLYNLFNGTLTLGDLSDISDINQFARRGSDWYQSIEDGEVTYTMD